MSFPPSLASAPGELPPTLPARESPPSAAASRDRAAELEAVFQHLPVAVAVATDSSGHRVRGNPAFARLVGLAGRPGASAAPFAPASPVRFFADGRELGAAELPLARALATGSPVHEFELAVVRPGDEPVDVVVHAVPLPAERSRPPGAVATFHEIGARKAAERRRLDHERRLSQARKLESLGTFAGGLAHDFNNLLAGVLGHANFARSELARGVATIDPCLAEIENGAQRAAELCRQLLSYAGQGRVVVRLVDLNVAVGHVLPLLRLSARRGIGFALELAEGLPPFRGDPTRLNQALLNLVANAAEAIGDAPGTIALRTGRTTLDALDLLTVDVGHDAAPGDYVYIRISDTGCGIPPEAIGHIFEPFFTTKFVGRGLGLSAVLGIVQGHHGAIRVSSRPGAGTSFELFFPVAPDSRRDRSDPAMSHSALRRGTVLVVDDEPAVRALATATLSSAGYAVATAADGEEAVALLRQDPLRFDVVLLDLSMPRLAGEDTLMALRMLAPELPVVVTSGHSEHFVAERFLGRGLASFLPKPFVSAALLRTVAAALARTPAP